MAKTPKKPRARVELYHAGGWRFRAIASNGREVGGSEQAIKQCSYQARRAVKQFPELPVIIVNADGTWEPYV